MTEKHEALLIEVSAKILARHRAPERIAPAFTELLVILADEVAIYKAHPERTNFKRIRELGEAFNSLSADDTEGFKVMTAAHFALKEYYKLYVDFLNNEWSRIGSWLA